MALKRSAVRTRYAPPNKGLQERILQAFSVDALFTIAINALWKDGVNANIGGNRVLKRMISGQILGIPQVLSKGSIRKLVFGWALSCVGTPPWFHCSCCSSTPAISWWFHLFSWVPVGLAISILFLVYSSHQLYKKARFWRVFFVF